MKLHLGCGHQRMDDYVNVDYKPVEGVTDVLVDLDGPDLAKHFEPDSVSESRAFHVIEHLRYPLEFMQALWTVTEPGGRVLLETPYGTSDDAWEDPTHVRPYFLGSWGYFGQPHHWRAETDYTADWHLHQIALYVDEARFADLDDHEVMNRVVSERNVVIAMRAELEAVKPARPALRELQDAQLPIALVRVPC